MLECTVFDQHSKIFNVYVLKKKKKVAKYLAHEVSPQNNFFEMAGQMSEQSSICPVVRVIFMELCLTGLMTWTCLAFMSK